MNILRATIALVALAGTPATAGPDQVSLLLGSEHVGATIDYEEFNPGVFVTWDRLLWNKRLDLTLGGFRNSYEDGSLVVSTALPLVREPDWGIDLFSALAWYPGNGERFSHSIEDFVPIAGLQARYRNFFVQAIPAGGESVDATLTFGLTFGLNAAD